MAKWSSRKSQNVEDDRTTSTGKGNRLQSSLSTKREAGMNSLRNYAVMNGLRSARQTQNAKALGLEGNLADLQNTANKMQAVRRTRMAGIDSPPIDYLINTLQKRKRR